MPTYDIKTHPLLSNKAKSLLAEDEAVFNAVTTASEQSLGLHGTSFTGSKEQDAILAIVYQVNYELEITPDANLYDSKSRGDRSWRYKSEQKATEPRAQKIADGLLEKLGTERQSNSISVPVNQNVW